MDSTKPTPDGPQMPGFGVARDLMQLRAHGAASVAELREFLAQARGRRPEDVLGMLAGSGLLRSVGAAAAWAAVVFVVGTIVPWWISGPPAGTAPAARVAVPSKPAAAALSEVKKDEKSPAAQSTQPLQAPAAPATAEAKPTPADAEKAVQVMGLGDTKIADPKKNPLEKSLDNLLDKLE